MNILYITTSLPFGSGETFVLPEIEELERLGHTVFIAPMFPRGEVMHARAKPLVQKSLVRKIITSDILLGGIQTALSAPIKTAKALGLIRTTKPLHLSKNLLFFPKALWLAGQAQTLEIEHIHVHWVSTTASMAMAVSEITGIPWSFTAHRWDVVENNLVARKAEHATLARFISKSGLEMAQKNGLSPSPKTQVLHIGICIPEAVDTSPKPKTHSSFRLMCPANLLPVKGHTYLLKAIQKLTDLPIELWLAGDGDLRKTLEDESRVLGISDRVQFLGSLPHNRLLELYDQNEIDAVVLPSVDLGNGEHEGIPVSLMEAMAHKIPVISTATGGIPELISDGAGLMVEPKQPEAIASAIRKLYESAELRHSLSITGFARVEREFNQKTIIQSLEKHFLSTKASAMQGSVSVRGTKDQ